MNTKKVLQIEGVEAAQLYGLFDGLLSEVVNLKNQLSGKQEPTDYLTRKEVSKMFNVSLVTINDWTNKGVLKAYKLANRVYFKRAEIEVAMIEIKATRRGYNG